MTPNERTQFRHLTEEEARTVETVCCRSGNYTILTLSVSWKLADTLFSDIIKLEMTIQFSHLGSGFTVCVLKIGNQIKLGASRCSHLDRPNRIKGEMLALKRAVTSKAPPINLCSLSIKDEPDTVSSNFPLDFSYNPPQRKE